MASFIYDMENDLEEFLRESNAIEKEFSEEALEDAKKAWKFAMQQETITDLVVLEIHRILMQRLRPDIAGKWRNRDVWIGGSRKKYTDESLLLWELRNALMGMWTSKFMETKIPFRLTAKSHIMFEECHPFEDGNGRTGRILYNWHRLQLKLPIHVIHTGKEQQEYYSWFTEGI